MTVHSETERDRGVSLARLRSADKTGRTTLCLCNGREKYRDVYNE